MRWSVTPSDIDTAASQLEDDVAGYVTSAMGEATRLLQGWAREDVEAGFPDGRRLAQTWRARTYPRAGTSLDAAGWVYTKAPQLIDAFDRGVTIRAKQGTFLALPTEAAGKTGTAIGAAPFGRQRRVRITPGGFERRTGLKLRMVYQRGGLSMLVVDAARLDRRGRATRVNPRGRYASLYKQGGHTIVVFILVPQVRLKKRLHLEELAARIDAAFPGLLTKNWR